MTLTFVYLTSRPRSTRRPSAKNRVFASHSECDLEWWRREQNGGRAIGRAAKRRIPTVQALDHVLLSYKPVVGEAVCLVFPAMSSSYSAEQQVAVAAVRRACVLTASVFNKLVKNETLTKDDKSPVTGQCHFAMLLEDSRTCGRITRPSMHSSGGRASTQAKLARRKPHPLYHELP